MRRTLSSIILASAAVLVAASGVTACGEDGVKVSFDANGKAKACSALKSVDTEITELSGDKSSLTVGDAQKKVDDISSKLKIATDSTTGFAKTVLAPINKALDAATKKLSTTDSTKSLSEVPGAADTISKVETAHGALTKTFKCA